jgi:SAM-dependent methyltransferase
VKPSFVEILTCPRCGSSLRLSGGEPSTKEVESGGLICQQGHQFPIVGGIPRFVDSELYVQNFGFEWNLHARTQLDTSSSDESERTFRAKTGFTPEQLQGKSVLDVGCGMGRFSDVAARWGATVVGIDLSSAVEAARRNVGGRDNVHIAQANIFELPFREGTFDFIFSIGVLHHTPNTKAAFDNLPKLLRKDGKIAIWLYTRYDGFQWRFSDFYRRFTPRLPKRLLHTLSYAAIPLYYVYKVPLVGLFLRWVLPVSNHPKAEWRVLDTFDWYSPQYQWKHSYEEVFPWFEEHGLKDIRVLGIPVAVQGTKR